MPIARSPQLARLSCWWPHRSHIPPHCALNRASGRSSVSLARPWIRLTLLRHPFPEVPPFCPLALPRPTRLLRNHHEALALRCPSLTTAAAPVTVPLPLLRPMMRRRSLKMMVSSTGSRSAIGPAPISRRRARLRATGFPCVERSPSLRRCTVGLVSAEWPQFMAAHVICASGDASPQSRLSCCKRSRLRIRWAHLLELPPVVLR